MKHLLASLCILLATALASSCGPMGMGAPQQSAYLAALSQAHTLSTPQRIDLYKQLEQQYPVEHFPLTRLTIQSSLAMYLGQAGRYGESKHYADTAETLLERIKAMGLETIDDDGMGRPWQGVDPAFRGGRTREDALDTALVMLRAAAAQYMEASGEGGGAAAKWAAMAQQSKEQQRRAMDSLTAQGMSEEQARSYKEQMRRDMDTRERLMEMTATLLVRHAQGASAQADRMVDDIAALAARTSFNLNPGQNAAHYRQYGMEAEAREYELLDTYYQNKTGKAWTHAYKAALLHAVARDQDALAAIETAFALFRATPAPALSTRSVRQHFESIKVTYSLEKMPFFWRALDAEIRTALKIPGTPALWEALARDLDAALAQTGQNAAVSVERSILHAYYGPIIRNKAARLAAELHTMEGDTANALGLLDTLLAESEAARASFQIEAHKIGYLAANKGLYEQYLALTASDPAANLRAMERAKSRAMVDILAEGVGALGNPELTAVAALRQQASGAAFDAHAGQGSPGAAPAAAKTRQVEDMLKTLKEANPELHSLVSVDVPDTAALVALLPPDTVAVSYYLARDSLYATLIGQGVRRTVRQAVPIPALYRAVHAFRNAIVTGEDAPAQARGGVAFSWTSQGDADTITVSNNMPFPLEIGFVGVASTYLMPGFSYPMLPADQTRQTGYATEAKAVEPGQQAAILTRTRSTAVVGAFRETVHIDTNMGRFRLSAVVGVTSQGADLAVTELPPPDAPPLGQSLHDLLIKPFAAEIAGKNLVIAPHGVLHFLPFEALRDATGRYLIEDHAVSYTPSLGVLAFCRAKNRRQGAARVAAFADPLGDLPGTREEVARIARINPGTTTRIGAEVTKAAVAQAMTAADIIHFACHGLYNPYAPLASGLVVARPGQAGLVSLAQVMAQPEHILNVTEIMRMHCAPALVFLSACDTGRARVSGGDELIGLVRAFFVAGSPSLVTTLWPIADEPSALLVERFYAELKSGKDKARALQAAKRHLMAKGYAPYYWSPFVLQGDWL
ncbi:MAG: CHAT domain-containing protein [Desulfovibrionaceae bacterium]